jgi:hypothetical protein
LKCDRVRELVSDALDVALEGSVKEAFHGHLETCPPCRVFHDEMQQSLLLLEELPVVEVTDAFDDVVWSRVRGLEPPRSLRELVRRRWADTWSRIDALPGFARWSPAAVAVAVAMMVMISPQPESLVPQSEIARGDVDVPAEANPVAGTSVETELASVSEPESGLREVEVPVESREPAAEEVYAGMPDAVEAFLENARELRLQADSDRYRRSNYSYPLRHVRTPRLGQSVSTQPLPVSATSSEPEARVISF